MKLIVPALLFTIFLVAPTLRADSFTTTYVATDTLTSATATSESWAWTFTGPQATFGYVANFAPSSFLPFWGFTGDSGLSFISGTLPEGEILNFFHDTGSRGAPMNDCFLGQTFGIIPCDPGRVNVWFAPIVTTTAFAQDGSSATFFTDLGLTPIGSFPVEPPPTSTPEPGSLVLLGSGVLGLVFGKRLIS
jgi:hypothetical protein